MLHVVNSVPNTVNYHETMTIGSGMGNIECSNSGKLGLAYYLKKKRFLMYVKTPTNMTMDGTTTKS